MTHNDHYPHLEVWLTRNDHGVWSAELKGRPGSFEGDTSSQAVFRLLATYGPVVMERCLEFEEMLAEQEAEHAARKEQKQEAGDIEEKVDSPEW